MTAVLVGLDMNQATAMLPPDVDRMIAMELFIVAEASFVAAVLKRAESEKDDDHGRK